MTDSGLLRGGRTLPFFLLFCLPPPEASSLSISLLHFVVSSGSCVGLSGAPQGMGYVLFMFSCRSLSVLSFVCMFERCCFCCNNNISSCSYFVLVVHVQCLSCGRHGCGCSLLVSVWFSRHRFLRYNKYFLTTTGQPHTPLHSFTVYTHACTHTRTYTRRRTTTTVTQASQRRGPVVWPCAAQRCGPPGLSAGGEGGTRGDTDGQTNEQTVSRAFPRRGLSGDGRGGAGRAPRGTTTPLRRHCALCACPGAPRVEGAGWGGCLWGPWEAPP